MDKLRPTMTIHELEIDLRACGEKTSAMRVAAMIEAGHYSDFASCVRVSPGSSRRTFEIHRKPYEEWKIRKGLTYA